jgi:hypothetical protein
LPAGANREERYGTHAVEFSFGQVIKLYEPSGIAHRPDHEVAPCPRLPDYISGFIQKIAFFQFAGDTNHSRQSLAKILQGVRFTPLDNAIDVGFCDVDSVRTDTRERINHP